MIASGVPTLSEIASMFAVPPIQLPDSAARPFQDSGGRNPPNTANAIGPPMMIPIVPVRSMIRAVNPSFAMAGRSTLTMSSMSAKGRR